jgi:hypothetical protein
MYGSAGTGADPRILIRTEMSRIRNTGSQDTILLILLLPLPKLLAALSSTGSSTLGATFSTYELLPIVLPLCRLFLAIDFLVIKKHLLLNYLCNSAGRASLLRAAVTGQQGEERTHHSEQLIPALSQVNVPLGTPGNTLVTNSVADPDPGSWIRCIFGPGSSIRNRFFLDPDSRIPDPKPIFLRD